MFHYWTQRVGLDPATVRESLETQSEGSAKGSIQLVRLAALRPEPVAAPTQGTAAPQALTAEPADDALAPTDRTTCVARKTAGPSEPTPGDVCVADAQPCEAVKEASAGTASEAPAKPLDDAYEIDDHCVPPNNDDSVAPVAYDSVRDEHMPHEASVRASDNGAPHAAEAADPLPETLASVSSTRDAKRAASDTAADSAPAPEKRPRVSTVQDHMPDSEREMRNKYDAIENWDPIVSRICSLKRTSDRQLVAVVGFENGDKLMYESSLVNQRCPQAIIRFYEERLKFPTRSSARS